MSSLRRGALDPDTQQWTNNQPKQPIITAMKPITLSSKNKLRANLQAILDAHCADSVAMLARNAYKYTDCGAWVGAEVGDKWLYDIELRKIGPKTIVTALKVGSIVEGADQETEVHELDLAEFDSPEAAAQAYSQALEEVETEANDIWNQTHGCERCRRHWLEEFGPDPDDEFSHYVWEDCPECHGHGTVI